MKKILSYLLLLSMLIGVLTVPAYAESTNLVPENNSTFESGSHTWTCLGSGGKLEVVNNPDGSGKVLKYSEIPEQTFASPQLDVRKYIQDGITGPSTITMSMDLYAVGDALKSVLVRMRTATKNGFSMCANAGTAYTHFIRISVDEEDWTTVEFSFEVLESDLSSAEPWNICFDNLYATDKTLTELYIDNVIITAKPSTSTGTNNTNTNNNNNSTGNSVDNTIPAEGNFIPVGSATFEEGNHTWKLLGAGGKLEVTDNPDGDGQVLAYTDIPEQTFASPILDIRQYIQDNVSEETTVYGTMNIYSEGKDFKGLLRIRTKTEAGFSMCETDGVAYCSLTTTVAAADTWTTVPFEIEITESDLAATEYWNLCFDGIFKDGSAPDAFYIDNIFLSDEEPDDGIEDAPIPEKTGVTRFDQTLVGTIRWDAFTNSTVKEGVAPHPAAQVAKVLSPKKYHSQAPFFSIVNDDDTISFPEYTVETWEKEAEYAAAGGIDYYAYIWYETTDDMSQPRKLHLESNKKNLVKMAGALERLRSPKSMEELYEAMKDSCYLSLDGRPVIFLYSLDSWTAEDVAKLRQGAANAGIKKALYVVGMSTTSKIDKFTANLAKDIDAISWYGVGALSTGETYEVLAERCEGYVKDVGALCLAFNIDFIPAFTTGRDTRARIETGVTWVDGDPNAAEDKDKPYHNWWTYQPTMDELEAHIKNVVTHASTSPQCKTNMVLSYGWNEHEEGGWFCPTLLVDENGDLILDANGKPQANTERLDTLKRALESLGMSVEIEVTPSPLLPSVTATATPAGALGGAGGFNPLFIIIPVAAALVVGAGAAVVVIVIKKKKQQ